MYLKHLLFVSFFTYLQVRQMENLQAISQLGITYFPSARTAKFDVLVMSAYGKRVCYDLTGSCKYLGHIGRVTE